MSTSIIANAEQGSTVYGHSSSTGYHGYVNANITSYGADAETYSYRDYGGREGMYAYVECVNSQGYRIGSGRESYGTSYAYSGYITRASAVGASGAVGTSTGSSTTYCSY